MEDVANVSEPKKSNLPAAGGGPWRGVKDYLPLAGFVVVTAGLYALLIPLNLLTENWRPAAFAFLCGGLVGIAEIASRYRDEPIQAIRIWPWGLSF